MNFPKFLSLFFCFAVLIGTAMAHPGHGAEHSDPHGIFHYLTSLVHLIPLLTILGIVLFAIVRKRAASKKLLRK
ncbi:hypothetical protein [Tunicatimonas pelagia]|uniref:hypothetical protein n=1 Tax=Tunicatimonas pelagia TaxID=931531 RepID=UPI002665E495|nr:hypothetical protein [Tunicatimonas pelagia]WKN42948.1 hypothetical protein P0M28_28320 [Tunicatimonas pelagia]